MTGAPAKFCPRSSGISLGHLDAMWRKLRLWYRMAGPEDFAQQSFAPSRTRLLEVNRAIRSVLRVVRRDRVSRPGASDIFRSMKHNMSSTAPRRRPELAHHSLASRNPISTHRRVRAKLLNDHANFDASARLGSAFRFGAPVLQDHPQRFVSARRNSLVRVVRTSNPELFQESKVRRFVDYRNRHGTRPSVISPTNGSA
jgi:hypothetical protein